MVLAPMISSPETAPPVAVISSSRRRSSSRMARARGKSRSASAVGRILRPRRSKSRQLSRASRFCMCSLTVGWLV